MKKTVKLSILLLFSVMLYCCSTNDDNAGGETLDTTVVSIEIDESERSFVLGKDATVPGALAKNASGEPINNIDFEWSSADEEVLRIDPLGNVFSKSVGQTELTASYDGVSASAGVEVMPPSGIGDFNFYSNGTRLRASINLPSGAGPFPAVVFTHGSGNGPGASRPTLQGFADVFTANGIAVFFYDKRGVGESGGIFSPTPIGRWLLDLGDDAIAALQFMRIHSSINPDQVGYYGVSQGGWVNPIATVQTTNVAFMVNVVGPVCTLGEELFYSDLVANGTSIEAANAAVYTYSGPHGYDPVEDLEVIDIPGLWVLGGQDESIPTEVTIDRLNTLISNGKPYDFNLIPNANHALIDVTTGEQRPWITPAGGVVDWIMDNVN